MRRVRLCSATRRDLKEAVLAALPSDTGWSDLEVVKSIDYAVQLGVLTIPAVAIDGMLVFAKLPTAQQLVYELRSEELMNARRWLQLVQQSAWQRVRQLLRATT